MDLRIGIFILLLLSMASSGFVATRIYDQDDLGDVIFKEFTYSIAVDCNESLIKIIVMNGSNMPVEDAKTYLQYLENTNPIISSIISPANGITIHELPGNTKYMRSRWNLLIEKSGFRSKAVQFDLAPCYSDWVPPVYKPPAANNITGSNQQIPKINTTNNTNDIIQNISKNESGWNDDIQENTSLALWFPVVLLIAVLLIIFKSVKQSRVYAPKRNGNSSNSSDRMYWRKQKKAN